MIRSAVVLQGTTPQCALTLPLLLSSLSLFFSTSTNPAMMRIVAHHHGHRQRLNHRAATIIAASIRKHLQQKKYQHLLQGLYQFNRLVLAHLTQSRRQRLLITSAIAIQSMCRCNRAHQQLRHRQLLASAAIVLQCMYRCTQARQTTKALHWHRLQTMLQQQVLRPLLRFQTQALSSFSIANRVMRHSIRTGMNQILPALVQSRKDLHGLVHHAARQQWAVMVTHMDQRVVPIISEQWQTAARIIHWYRFRKILKTKYLKHRRRLHNAAIVVQKRWKVLKWKKTVAHAKVRHMMQQHTQLMAKKKKKRERKEYKKKLKTIQKKMRHQEKLNMLKTARTHGDALQEELADDTLEMSAVSSVSSSSESEEDLAQEEATPLQRHQKAQKAQDKKAQELKMVQYIEQLVVARIAKCWTCHRLYSAVQGRIRVRKATQLQQWYRNVQHNITFKRHLFLFVRIRKLEHGEWCVEKEQERLEQERQYLLLLSWHAGRCQAVWRWYVKFVVY